MTAECERKVPTCQTLLGGGRCTKDGGRRCDRCGRWVCAEHALYRGCHVGLDAKIVTCDDCDYVAFSNTYGGI
jgi:hypothetical protein